MANSSLVSQVATEVVESPTSQKACASQVAAEVLVGPTSAKSMAGQVVVEVLVLDYGYTPIPVSLVDDNYSWLEIV